MAKRRNVIPVTLNLEQRQQLERLWFYYGNYGPKTTPGNHSFIQRLLENGVDERPLYTKRTPKSERPTTECERAVEAILAVNSSIPHEEVKASHLRVISSNEKQGQVETDPEMKAVLEDMKRRYRVMHERLDDDSDTPDAA
jgi:hypothetical protein